MTQAADTVRDRLATLASQIEQLRKEIHSLNETFGTFHGRPAESGFVHIPVEWSGGKSEWVERPETPEPKNEIKEALKETETLANLDVTTKILRAMARSLDGAFRDVRATRADVAAIKDNSDSRDNFREWMERNQG